MRNVLNHLLASCIFAALVSAAPAARAQDPVYVTPNGVYDPNPTPTSGAGAIVTVNGMTVRVPDGGTALLAGYSRSSSMRTEAGAPLLGKLPYSGRLFRNTGYGRDSASVRVAVTLRIINLHDEEYRQTGFRSP